MMSNAQGPGELIHRHSGDPGRTQRLGPYAIESLIDPEEERAGTAYRVRIEPHQRTRTHPAAAALVQPHRSSRHLHPGLLRRRRRDQQGQQHRLSLPA